MKQSDNGWSGCCVDACLVKKRKPRAKHVVLISVDGMRPIYYLDDRFPAPAMQQLYREGAQEDAGADQRRHAAGSIDRSASSGDVLPAVQRD